ncbi:hypothetical protein A3F45_04185 [Candidatus Curtissbacteria bacterium RIFCSPHIGHO2_12_FULL_41_17]|uniref:Uncharacterized protein n=2 Tax=Candidatus Curtissiibacteriota TaxID=1752717 RepID=A0A1F5HKK4_9BACT|nr:MAG: hypothetical protein A2693_04455 [Candidatus Curtissbacteria bacterium RIFCSPHIGHO2_01_FULL_40_12]OGE04648.1 MAG: hypothetical protein A3F45_04185 [Candidatus Curtissbacteria bacterium RIFCSPHIGHO2_12_FULL_41_17]
MQLPTIAILKSENSAQLTKLTNLAAPVGALVISVLILIFVVWPKFSEVLRLRTANRDLTTRAFNLTQKADKLGSLDNLLLEGQLVAAEQLLPSDKSVFTLVSQIEKTAGASGVLLSRVELTPGNLSENAAPDKPVAAQSAAKDDTLGVASKIQLKISISSDYRSLVIFLNNILSLPRAVAVRDLTIAASSSSGSSQIKASMLVDAYWKALPKQLASIESPVEEPTPNEASRLERISSTGFSTLPSIPSVPLGRQDIFAPF